MRPKRTFFRAERVRVVPPERESPPQAPPAALPAAGAAGGPARRRRSPASLPLTGVRGTRFCSFPGLGHALGPGYALGLGRAPGPGTLRLADRPAGPGGLRLPR